MDTHPIDPVALVAGLFFGLSGLAILAHQQWEDVDVTGGAFSLGGGIYVYFSETLALEVGLKVSSGQFTQIDLGPVSLQNLDIDAQSSRFKVGIVWWP